MGSQPRGISASRGAAVLGLSEFMTPLDVWQQIMEEREPGFNAKRGYTLPAREESAAMRFGTAFESAVIGLAERAQGRRILDREEFYSVNGCGDENFFERRIGECLANYITCHIDGRYESVAGNAGFILHEGKTTSAMAYREKWGEPGTDRVPRTYQVQVQHQMLCTGAEEAVVSVLVFPETPDKWEAMGWRVERIGNDGDWYDWRLRNSKISPAGIKDRSIGVWAEILNDMGYFHQYPVKANPEAQRRMAEAYRGWWHRHVLEGVPPEPRTYADVLRLFTEPVGTVVDQQITAWMLEINAIKKEIGKGGAAARRLEKLKLRVLDRTRKLDAAIDDESREKTVWRDGRGDKLGQYSKAGGFR